MRYLNSTGTALVALPESKETQAKLVGNPTGVNNQIGAFVTPPGAANPIHTPTDNTIKFGLVASSSTTAFDMAGLPVGNDVAVCIVWFSGLMITACSVHLVAPRQSTTYLVCLNS